MRLTKSLYDHAQPCATEGCPNTTQVDGYGQVYGGLCLDCQVEDAYDAMAEANGIAIFGSPGNDFDEPYFMPTPPFNQRRPIVSDDYLVNESSKNRRFMRRHHTTKAKRRRLIILERQLGDHEYFKRDANYRYQEAHEPWKDRTRHLVQRNRSIRQVLMRTWADDGTRHNYVCGGYYDEDGGHECSTPDAIHLGGNWRRYADRSKWYREPITRKTATRYAIREAVNDHLDASWEQPALRIRKEPRLSEKELAGNSRELQPPRPQINQHYSFAEWLDAYAALSKRSRKRHRLSRCRPCQGIIVDYRQHHCGFVDVDAYTTTTDPDHFLIARPALYWPLKRWLRRHDWRYTRPIRLNGVVIWHGPRSTYVNSAAKRPYKSAPPLKKGGANWGQIQLA